MRILVLLLTSPLREQIQSVLNIDVGSTSLVPRGSRLHRGWALGLGDEETGQSKRDVKRALIQIRGSVDLVYNVRPGRLCRIERCNISAVRCDSDEGNLASCGTSSGTPNTLNKIDTSAVPTDWRVVDLTFSKE